MSFFNRLIKVLQKLLPSPFAIAILLTFLTFFLALFLTTHTNSETTRIIELASFWEKGFWELLAFAMQMMLMLILGHVLALTSIIDKLIHQLTKYCKSTAKAALIIGFSTIAVSFLNWGLGLIFGAILARKIGEHAKNNNFKINYPLIGAAGYSGLMVWHGGLSGSAPLKIAEANHFLVDKIGIIPVTETLFSPMNIGITIALLIIIPVSLYFIGKKSQSTKINLSTTFGFSIDNNNKNITGAEKLDTKRWFIIIFALLIITSGIINAYKTEHASFLNLNYINFILLGMSLLLHKNLISFKNAVNKAIIGASGIMIQFPLYAGIMGIMKYSGLTEIFTDYFINISNTTTFPIFAFISAGFVNMFVPSGGGQWAIQGPVLIDAAKQLGVSVPKIVMALAYGDQITNMLQPFWALPLLGITQLKAKEIIPYTFIIMLIGIVIFITGLLLT